MCVYNSSWNRRFRFHEKTFTSFRYLEPIEFLSRVDKKMLTSTNLKSKTKCIVQYLIINILSLRVIMTKKAAVTVFRVRLEQISELCHFVCPSPSLVLSRRCYENREQYPISLNCHILQQNPVHHWIWILCPCSYRECLSLV